MDETEAQVIRSSALLRFLVLWTMALMIVAAMASSSAHAFVLGEASARSVLGEPLQVVIPLKAAPGETITAECYGLERLSGDGFAAPLTARVSLERVAAARRLVVTTLEPVAEPVLRLSLRAGCETGARQDYVMLLDPPAARTAPAISATAAGSSAPQVREPRQDRSAAGLLAAARRDSPEGSGTGEPRGQRPVGAEPISAPLLRYASLNGDDALGARAQSSFRQVAAVSETVRVVPSTSHIEPRPADRSQDTWWTIVVAVSGLGVILLGAVLVRHGRAAPRAAVNGTMRATTPRGARAITRRSASQTTIASTNVSTDALLTRAAPSTRSWVSPASAPTVPNTSRGNSRRMAGTRSLSHAARVPDDALDSLLNEIESDLNVEDAVRQAHAAVHGNAGGDIGCDAILQAIEDAERHLMLNPPAPVETALDDELLDKPRQRNKAA